MSANEAGTSRRFVASAEALGTGWIKGTKIWQVGEKGLTQLARALT